MSLINPIIEYPAVPQNALKKTNMKKIQVVHNKALRFIYNARYP